MFSRGKKIITYPDREPGQDKNLERIIEKYTLKIESDKSL
jgi:hypothetical protein